MEDGSDHFAVLKTIIFMVIKILSSYSLQLMMAEDHKNSVLMQGLAVISIAIFPKFIHATCCAKVLKLMRIALLKTFPRRVVVYAASGSSFCIYKLYS